MSLTLNSNPALICFRIATQPLIHNYFKSNASSTPIHLQLHHTLHHALDCAQIQPYLCHGVH